MNVTFRFCFRSPLKSLKLPVFKGLSTDLGSHSFLHISFYPLYKEVTNLLIGYAPKKVSESMILSCMGFRFRADGSVWVGTGNLSTMTGYYIHFRSDGCIDIGKFDDSYLEERMSLQELIDNYFGTQRINEDNPFGSFFRSSPKSTFQIERESERELYRDIEEPKVNFNYFTGNYEYNDDYSGDLPF